VKGWHRPKQACHANGIGIVVLDKVIRALIACASIDTDFFTLCKDGLKINI
jgi:hypothetical protein